MTHRPLYCLLLLAYVLASLFVPALASASTGPCAWTRVKGLDLGIQYSIGAARPLTISTHQGYAPTYDPLASDSLLAPRGGAKLLNPPISITGKGLAHTLERHAAGGVARFAGKSKFNAGEDIAKLIRSGTQQPMVRQANGNFARTFDVGREIGFSRNVGGPTSIMTIITDRNGNLVTAFPGQP